jgi:hypothetical protein
MFSGTPAPTQPSGDERCPVCNGNTFESGRLAQTYYIPGRSLWNFTSYQYLRARRCLTCGNIQLFTDPALSRNQGRVALVAAGIAIVVALLGVFLAFALSVPPR